MNLSKYQDKKIRVKLTDGREFEALGTDYMIGDDFEEEYNSLSLEITKVIINGKVPKYNLQPYIDGKILYAIYENQNVIIEEI
ncbi:hypothetical protein [Clostridium gasigenes]|uniref:Uncharacterized protein n=1 Tax=Clostridium gasigenes TaxID=94869 RepID=A0A1H0N5I8_9CLOT|nr:hypothetical protein [Clostridium gasigenes]MBB6623818.1 hypothetical protein [Clostridium gasigenes]SDO87913.1 hypothetical protein SAMN04488529_101696 [Clostridium gasigenes]